MKLVVCYTTTDGYTYSVDHAIPVEFESSEALLVAFDEGIQRYRASSDRSNTDLRLGSHTFDVLDFIQGTALGSSECTLPDIFTLEEWFDRYSKS